MRPTSLEHLQNKKILELARYYESLGYRVFADLKDYESPRMFAGIRPDLVAEKDDQSIIIEVKTRDSLESHKRSIEALARYAKQNSNIRFDLVLTNPKPQSKMNVKVRSFQAQLNTMEIGLIEEIRGALVRERIELAVTLIAILLEGFMTRLAEQNDIRTLQKERNLRSLSYALYTERIISEPLRQLTEKIQAQRNSIVHGKKPSVSVETVRDWFVRVVTLIRR